MKNCPKCKLFKESNQFYMSKDNKIKCWCKSCCLEDRNTRGRNAQLIKRYGIDINQYNQLFANQDGKCKVCGKHQSELTSALAVDHCHASNEVRGLLCYKCNIGIGYFNDNISLLSSAITYLNNFNDK